MWFTFKIYCIQCNLQKSVIFKLSGMLYSGDFFFALISNDQQLSNVYCAFTHCDMKCVQ